MTTLLEALPDFLTQDLDETSNPFYYGFSRKDGKWYLLREDTTSATTKAYRVACKSNNPLVDNYASAWTARATLNYDYIYSVQI